MYTITGITGKVGGTLARKLLQAKLLVSAVMRDAAKGQAWVDQGGEVAIAEMDRDEGVIPSFLQPADKSFAVVATEDIGRIAAELISKTGLLTE